MAPNFTASGPVRLFWSRSAEQLKRVAVLFAPGVANVRFRETNPGPGMTEKGAVPPVRVGTERQLFGAANPPSSDLDGVETRNSN